VEQIHSKVFSFNSKQTHHLQSSAASQAGNVQNLALFVLKANIFISIFISIL